MQPRDELYGLVAANARKWMGSEPGRNSSAASGIAADQPLAGLSRSCVTTLAPLREPASIADRGNGLLAGDSIRFSCAEGPVLF